MRQLNITTENKAHLSLENIPDEYRFVEAISRRHASTMQELEHFYKIGVEAAEKFQSNTTQERYDSKVAWVVKQTILKAQKNTSNQV